MKMTVVQPCYFADVKTLSRIAHADVLVWADSFRYTKHSTINRTKIKTVSGSAWLTAPVKTTGRSAQEIRSVQIDREHHWKQTHLRSLEVSYQNSAYYNFFPDDIEKIVLKNYFFLNEMLLGTLDFLKRKMRLEARVVRSLDLPMVEDRSRRVAAWLEACECDDYLVDNGDLTHIDPNDVKRRFKLTIFNFMGQEYYQLFQSYIVNLSGLDLLFNEGELSKSILLQSAEIERI